MHVVVLSLSKPAVPVSGPRFESWYHLDSHLGFPLRAFLFPYLLLMTLGRHMA